MEMSLEGRIAVVTGAANGIGRGCALRLARDGADLALLDIDSASLAALVDDIQEIGRRVLPIAVDCTKRDAVAAAFGQIRRELGRVDVLLNNIGQSARERMSEFSSSNLDTLDFLLAVNLSSCILCSRQVVEDMRQRRTGKIINIASESAVNGSPKTWDYSAAKAGVIGFTRSIARELAPFGITVNAIGPGLTRTRALDQLPRDVVDRLAREIPMGRIGEVEDIANAVAFFATDQSAYITGQTLLVNGGNWLL